MRVCYSKMHGCKNIPLVMVNFEPGRTQFLHAGASVVTIVFSQDDITRAVYSVGSGDGWVNCAFHHSGSPIGDSNQFIEHTSPWTPSYG